MTGKGFTYHKKNHVFRGTAGPASQEFLVDFDGRSGLVSVGGGFSVRFSKLEVLFEKAVGSAMGAGAFGGFSQMGIEPYKYDIFVNEYAAMTPKEKGSVDPALVHPQERVDEAVRYVVETYDTHVAPLFDRLSSYRGLSEFILRGTPGVTWTPGAPHAARAIPMALLLAAALKDDPAEILAYAEQAAPIYTGFDIRDLVARTQRFISQAQPGELLLD
ncbi:MAG TPA: hypothetical protein VF006_28315 [Longimicrobium sp.]